VTALNIYHVKPSVLVGRRCSYLFEPIAAILSVTLLVEDQAKRRQGSSFVCEASCRATDWDVLNVVNNPTQMFEAGRVFLPRKQRRRSHKYRDPGSYMYQTFHR